LAEEYIIWLQQGMLHIKSPSIIIKGIQMKEPTLEEVFLLLTGKEVKNENI